MENAPSSRQGEVRCEGQRHEGSTRAGVQGGPPKWRRIGEERVALGRGHACAALRGRVCVALRAFVCT